MPGAERPVQRRVRAVDQQSPRQPAVPQLQSVEAEPDPPDLTGALAADLRQRRAGGGDRVERTGTTVAIEVSTASSRWARTPNASPISRS